MDGLRNTPNPRKREAGKCGAAGIRDVVAIDGAGSFFVLLRADGTWTVLGSPAIMEQAKTLGPVVDMSAAGNANRSTLLWIEPSAPPVTAPAGADGQWVDVIAKLRAEEKVPAVYDDDGKALISNELSAG